MSIIKLSKDFIRNTVKRALNEDLYPSGDITSNLVKNNKVVKVKLPGLKTSPAVMSFGKEEYNPQVKHSLRLWPQDNDTEGFFVTKIRKNPPSEWNERQRVFCNED